MALRAESIFALTERGPGSRLFLARPQKVPRITRIASVVSRFLFVTLNVMMWQAWGVRIAERGDAWGRGSFSKKKKKKSFLCFSFLGLPPGNRFVQ